MQRDRCQATGVAGSWGASRLQPPGCPAAAFSPGGHAHGVWVCLGVPGCVSITLPRVSTQIGNHMGATDRAGHQHGLCFCHRACLCVCGLVSPGVSAWAVLVHCQTCLCVSVSFPCGWQVRVPA